MRNKKNSARRKFRQRERKKVCLVGSSDNKK